MSPPRATCARGISTRGALARTRPGRALAARRPSRALLALCALLFACAPGAGSSGGGLDLAQPADSEVVLGEVAPFELTDSAGKAVTRADLLGRAWAVDFFFTTCAGPCPRMSAAMAELARRTRGLDVRLVSITVDPRRDDPAALRAYAERFQADPARWLFLTGDEDAIYRLCRESFALAVQHQAEADEQLGLQVAHSTRLVTVDARGRIRGYYDLDGEDVVGAVAARLEHLAREAAGPERSAAPRDPRRTRLPDLNAVLNGTAALLLGAGWLAIRGGRRELHAWLMRAAFLVSVAFLASYLTYHFVVVPRVGETRLHVDGPLKLAYLAMLASHVLLAVVNLPLVLRTLWLAHAERWDAHRRMARITWPIWMYVSVTGVLVYLALYVWNPPG